MFRSSSNLKKEKTTQSEVFGVPIPSFPNSTSEQLWTQSSLIQEPFGVSQEAFYSEIDGFKLGQVVGLAFCPNGHLLVFRRPGNAMGSEYSFLALRYFTMLIFQRFRLRQHSEEQNHHF